MLWLRRNRFVGSYAAVVAASILRLSDGQLVLRLDDDTTVFSTAEVVA